MSMMIPVLLIFEVMAGDEMLCCIGELIEKSMKLITIHKADIIEEVNNYIGRSLAIANTGLYYLAL